MNHTDPHLLAPHPVLAAQPTHWALVLAFKDTWAWLEGS